MSPPSPKNPWIVVAAHPDDETIGATCFLRQKCGLIVVHATDGAPRDARLRAPHAPPARRGYANQRRREAERALGLVGVGPAQIRRLGFVDQELTYHLVELTRAIERLFAELSPVAVLVHPYEGGHPDHDACAFAVHAAAATARRRTHRAPSLLEMTSYHRWHDMLRTGAFLPPDAAELICPLTPRNRELKQRMLDCFESQREVLSSFRTEEERFRPAPAYDFAEPPHAGPLHYELLGWPVCGDDFRRAAKLALAQLAPRRARLCV